MNRGWRGVRAGSGAAMVIVLAAGCAPKHAVPPIHLATQAQIDAVLPKELVTPKPVDPAARKRYHNFCVALDGLKDGDSKFAMLFGRLPRTPGVASPDEKAEVFAPGISYWNENASALSRISAALDAGRFQSYPIQPVLSNDEMKRLSMVFELVRAASVSAEALVDRGDYQHALGLLKLNIRLADRLLDSSEGTLEYTTAIFVKGIALAGFDRAARNPRIPVDVLGQILNFFPSAIASDEALARSIRENFQQEARKELSSDPIGVFKAMVATQRAMREYGNELSAFDADTNPVPGTLEPVETARLCGRRVQAEISNLHLPLSQFDNSVEEASRKSVDEIIFNKAQPGISLKKEEYKASMESGHNTIGSAIAFGIVETVSTRSISFKTRAEQNAIRVLLASAIYRRTHGGALPPTIDDFLPILGKWPVDPYTGKGMIYYPKKQKVYAVGENLKDDGGDFSNDGYRQKDVGVSL